MTRQSDRTHRVQTPEGFRTVAYSVFEPDAAPEAGAPPLETVVCVHGLTRNRRDFDFLARHLVERCAVPCRVVTIDVLGRGDSECLKDASLYAYPTYVQAVGAVVQHEAGGRGVTYVGTSMGGIIGMLLSGVDGTPVKRLVLNDVGALVPKEALQRIAVYVGKAVTFADLAEAEAFFRSRYSPYGPGMTDELWRHMATHGTRPNDADGAAPGSLRLAYDTSIAAVFGDPKVTAQDADLWPFWSLVRAPVLILHGAESDILPLAVAERMAERDGVRLVSYPGVGHTPPLMTPETGLDEVAAFVAAGAQ